MNASFPYVSPAVSLPVNPPRRVVDAGYYDNYGVNLSAAWAFMNRDWIREHTSGLALVQIRAYASEERRKRLWAPSKPAPAGDPAAKPHWIEQLLTEFLDRIIIGVHALSTPFRSFFCARQWSMSYRNDEQVSLLGETFNIRYESGEGVNWKCLDRSHRREKNGWFESFVFENPLSFGMNWLITKGEIDEMKNLFHPDHGLQDRDSQTLSHNNLDQLERLKAWWQEHQETVEESSSTGQDGRTDPRPPFFTAAEKDCLL